MDRNREFLGILLREASALLALGLLAALLLVISRAASASPPGEGERGPEIPPLCGGLHRNRGESMALDLEAVGRGYLELRKSLETSLHRSRAEVETALDRPYDAGLPNCGRPLVRKHIPPAPLPRALWGQKLAFIAVRDPSRVLIPPRAIEEDPRAEILIMAAARPRDLGELSKTLGRRASLAGAELAHGLGVRCVNTWIEIGEKGDAVTLHEGD